MIQTRPRHPPQTFSDVQFGLMRKTRKMYRRKQEKKMTRMTRMKRMTRMTRMTRTGLLRNLDHLTTTKKETKQTTLRRTKNQGFTRGENHPTCDPTSLDDSSRI